MADKTTLEFGTDSGITTKYYGGEQIVMLDNDTLSLDGGTETSWTDIDLSAYIPAGATHAILQIYIWEASGSNSSVYFRKNGDSGNGIVVQGSFTGATTANVKQEIIINIDSDRVIEYKIGAGDGVDVIVKGYVIGGSDTSIDPNFIHSVDNDTASLSTGNATSLTDVDLSDYIPPGATHAIIDVQAYGASTSHPVVYIHKKGYTEPSAQIEARNDGGVAWVSEQCIVELDSSQVIQYYTDASTTYATIRVRGYIGGPNFIQTMGGMKAYTVDNATKIVDGGGTTATWVELDLSAYIPVNSKFAILNMSVSSSTATTTVLAVRKNGNTNPGATITGWVDSGGASNDGGQVIVEVDSDRKIEYYVTTSNTAYITVVGYIMDASDAAQINYVPLDNASYALNAGTATSRTDVDFSSFVPEGTKRVWCIADIRDDSSQSQVYAFVYKNGATNHCAKLWVRASATAGAFVIPIDLDDDLIVEYSVNTSSTSLSLTPVGYDAVIGSNNQVDVQEITSTPYNVHLGESSRHFNVNSSSTVVMNLPSVTSSDVGTTYTFAKTGTGQLTIQANDSDIIDESSAGGTLYCSEANLNRSVTIFLANSTNWVIRSYKGTWTTT